MNIERLSRQLENDEGVLKEVYIDSLGYKTVGIGHYIQDDDPSWLQRLDVGDSITERQMYQLFEDDLNEAIEDTKDIFSDVWYKFPDIAKEVFVNMVFNLGRDDFLEFKNTISAAKKLDWATVAEEMLDSLWAKQVKSRAYRLSAMIESLVC